MAKVVTRQWEGNPTARTRRDRSGCEYVAYVPDFLARRSFTFDGVVMADVAAAEAAILQLNVTATALTNTEALARILLRAEVVASSRIEGLEVGARRLLHAEVLRDGMKPSTDVTADEVLANIDAMSTAVATVAEGDEITLDTILLAHRELLIGTRQREHAGKLRTVQNWIGGSDFNPCSAAFVPPPEHLVEELMDDLVTFCNEDELPPVIQAALAHAQFETIHPFADGNGRTGRALIHMVMRRRGLAPHVLTPVSLVLATWAKTYVESLMAFRYLGDPHSPEAARALNQWTARFAAACVRACEDAGEFEQQIAEIRAAWRERVGTVRRNSALDLLLEALPGAPVVTGVGAQSLVNRSFPAVNNAIDRLLDGGILRQVSIGKRNRAFEAPEIIAAFSDFERQLASPTGDTRSSEPSRPVPRRRGNNPTL